MEPDLPRRLAGNLGRWSEAMDTYGHAAHLSRKLRLPTTAAELGTWDVSRLASPPLGRFKAYWGHHLAVDCSPRGR